ncbi:hypothetical protein Tco_0173613 [Tanacetum coccineum]
MTLRVRALVMTIGLDLPSQIFEAHKEAVKLHVRSTSYGRKCRSPVCWAGSLESTTYWTRDYSMSLRKDFKIRDRCQAVRDATKSYADKRRGPLN